MARSHCLAIFGICAASNPSSAPIITPTGLAARSVSSRPSAVGARNKSAETIFKRGAFGAGTSLLVREIWVMLAMISFLLIALALKVVEYLVERKAVSRRFGYKAVRK